MTETNQTNAEFIQSLKARAKYNTCRADDLFELCDRLVAADAEIERLRDDSEALRLLREWADRSDGTAMIVIGRSGGRSHISHYVELEILSDDGDVVETADCDALIEAVLKAKSAIERETEQEQT